jgi:hypothetical protein
VAEIFPYAGLSVSADQPPETAFPNGHTAYYPLIDLKIRIGSQTTPRITVLVDSGAYYCIFDSDAAQALGITVTSGKLKRISGLGGGTLDVYFFDVELLINSITVSCYAGFIDQPFPDAPLYVGLLGNHDFLTQKLVTLDAPNLEVRIG